MSDLSHRVCTQKLPKVSIAVLGRKINIQYSTTAYTYFFVLIYFKELDVQNLWRIGEIFNN